MKLYVYTLTDDCVVAIISGPTNDSCERCADDTYGSTDYGWTYSPALGCTDGLDVNDLTIYIHPE